MAVPYALVDNPLTPDPTDFRAAVQPGKSVTEQELIEMVVLHNTGITESVATKVISEYALAMRFFLSKGRNINASLLNSSYSISGVFTDEEDSFDPSRHQINLNLFPGIAIKDIADTVSTEKVEATVSQPALTSYFDTETSSKNQVLTPNEMGRINGKRLSFDETDPAQGVFFVNNKGKDFKVAKFGEHRPSKLIFKVPALADGVYKLEVRKANGQVGTLKSALSVGDVVVDPGGGDPIVT
uniref:DNA-binding domain-containing protein n=1 Tax=Roseihalotalea indica TaxID=2867963 RepID=A0AA49PZ93_9BACT|nr:DNA-binding domain-containing protein [Tunicatimonas sp. TK19036]